MTPQEALAAALHLSRDGDPDQCFDGGQRTETPWHSCDGHAADLLAALAAAGWVLAPAAGSHPRTYSLTASGPHGELFLVTDDESGINIGHANKIGGPLTAPSLAIAAAYEQEGQG